MPKMVDLTGQKFGSWTVIKRAQDHISNSGNRFTAWTCRCECGTAKDVVANSLLGGRSMSCGCKQYDHSRLTAKANFTTHGDSKTRLYKIWAGMKKRCTNPKSSAYPNYGARGIKVCSEWLNDFVSFKKWAMENGYNDALTIDRIDVNGDYSPENCRWSTATAQANNRRSNVKYPYSGSMWTLADLSRELNIPYKTLHKKIHSGIPLEKILQQQHK